MTPAPPRPGQDHILITGPGKTGTTGLFSSIKSGLLAAGFETRPIFEPSNPRKIDNFLCLAPGLPMLVKTTLDTQPRSVPDPGIFDRIVMTVRDPRDMLLSSLLFRPLTVASMGRTDAAIVEKFVVALEAKQADPAGTSIRELFTLAHQLGIGSPPFNAMVDDLHTQQRFLESHPVYVMQYERFVLDELDGLSEYLGFPVENVSASKSSMFGYITRSKGSGEFRQWFTADDLQYFNDLFEQFLVKFDYELDVELPAQPVIDPTTGSEYVRSGFARRTQDQLGIRTARSDSWSPKDVTTMDELQRLIDFGVDGQSAACARVAEVIASGHLGAQAGGPEDAIRWALAGAQIGGLPAMQLLVTLLADHASNDPAGRREARRWGIEVRRREKQLRMTEERANRDATIVQLRKAQRASKAAAIAAAEAAAARAPSARAKAALRDPKRAGRAALRRVKRRLKAKVRARSTAL